VLSILKIGSEVRARKPIVALKTPKGRLGDIFEFLLKMFKYSQLPTRTKSRYIPNNEYGCKKVQLIKTITKIKPVIALLSI
jgi:hypothetical protein